MTTESTTYSHARAKLAASKRGEGMRISVPKLRRRVGLRQAKAGKGRRKIR